MAVQQLKRLVELVRLDGLMRASHVRGVLELTVFERFSFGAGQAWHDGMFAAGPTPEGGFRVRASLPGGD